MPRVFVAQMPHRMNERSGALEPRFDLSTAERYGRVEFLLSPTARPFNPGPIVAELREKLSDYGDEDYLLLVGNPCIMGWACAIAADFNDGKVNILQWSGRDQAYTPI